MKFMRNVLILILIISCLSLSGCDLTFDLYDFKEGCYSSLLGSKDVKEYTLIYCDVKMVNKNVYKNSQDNIFIGDEFFDIYFLFDMRIKKYDMEEFSKVTFKNISSYRNERDDLIYKGNLEYVYNDTLINEEFEIFVFINIWWKLETLSIDEYLVYESNVLKINELRYENTKGYYEMCYPYTSAKLILTEIPEKDPFIRVVNQTQGGHAKQWIQIDFYLFNDEIWDYIKTTLSIERCEVSIGASIFIYGTGYLIEDNGNLLEFNFKLCMIKNEDIVEMIVYNFEKPFYEDNYLYAEYRFKKF